MHKDVVNTGAGAFYSPREVQTGDGCVDRLAEVLRRWGVPTGTVLLVCDAALRELGYVERVEDALRQGNYLTTVFADVAGEPDLATAEAVGQAVRRTDHVAVVGLGGGSAMDLSKIAAALATNPGEALALAGTGRVRATPLPLVCVPTTTGTGAEATRIAMLSLHGAKAIINDPALVPLAAVLDPELVASLPAPVTAATGMDALSHAVESWLSTAASPLSLAASRLAAVEMFTWLPRAYHNGDRPSRRATLHAAYLAGLALNAGVVLGHSIAYTIANRTNLPHGVTAAMALPYCVAYNAEAAADRIRQIAAVLIGHGGARELCERLVELNRQLGIPASLSDVGLGSSDVSAMAAECVEKYPRPTNPEP